MIDFSALKERITIEQAVAILGLEMKPAGNQLRGMCPECESEDPRTLVVTPSRGLFYCFKGQTGGDLIKLAAHVRNEGIREAAKYLWESTVQNSTVTVSDPPKSPMVPDKLEKVAARLIHDHEAVQILGLSPEMAKSLGIGFIKSGILAGRVLFPLFKDGQLTGYVGYSLDGLKFPPNIVETSNVVKFPKAG